MFFENRDLMIESRENGKCFLDMNRFQITNLYLNLLNKFYIALPTIYFLFLL